MKKMLNKYLIKNICYSQEEKYLFLRKIWIYFKERITLIRKKIPLIRGV